MLKCQSLWKAEFHWLLLMTDHTFNQTQREWRVSVITYSSAAWDSKRKWTPFNKRQQQIEKPQNFTSHWPSIKWWKLLQIRLNTIKISKLLNLSFLMHASRFIVYDSSVHTIPKKVTFVIFCQNNSRLWKTFIFNCCHKSLLLYIVFYHQKTSAN